MLSRRSKADRPFSTRFGQSCVAKAATYATTESQHICENGIARCGRIDTPSRVLIFIADDFVIRDEWCVIAFLPLLVSASGAVPADHPQSDLLGAFVAPGLSSAEELTVCDLMRAIKKGVGFASPLEASKAEAEQAALASSMIWRTAPRDLRCPDKKSRLGPLQGERAIERIGTSSDGGSVALSWSDKLHGGTYYFRKTGIEWRLACETSDWEF